jgi:hypothetical protein
MDFGPADGAIPACGYFATAAHNRLRSDEITTSAGGTVNVDYSIDGGAPIPIEPEFFTHDSAFFVTRIAHAATIQPRASLRLG